MSFLENTWVFPGLEALHLVAMVLFVGAIMLGDLRVLGVAATEMPPRLMKVGFWSAVATGLPMFLSGWQRYRENPAFLVKIAALVVALLIHNRLHARPTRATAAISLGLWCFIILAARAVIDFDA